MPVEHLIKTLTFLSGTPKTLTFSRSIKDPTNYFSYLGVAVDQYFNFLNVRNLTNGNIQIVFGSSEVLGIDPAIVGDAVYTILSGEAVKFSNRVMGIIKIYAVLAGTVQITASQNFPVEIEVGATSGTPSTGAQEVTQSDTGQIDATDRLRVSNQYSQFDSKQVVDDDGPFFATKVTGGSTITYKGGAPDYNPVSRLQVGAGAADFAVRQTRAPMNMQLGRSLLNAITFLFSPAATNVSQKCGYCDDNNGIYLQNDISGVSIVRRTQSEISDEVIPQANWNIDHFDGNGVSGLTLDITKGQTLLIDLEWPYGRIRCGFSINGKPYYFHAFQHSNTQSIVTLSNPNLKLHWGITAAGVNSGNAYVDAGACSCNSEGVYVLGGSTAVAWRDASNKLTGVGQILVPFLSLRYRPGYESNSIITDSIDLHSASGANALWYVIANPVLTGPVWANLGNTGLQWDTTSTAISGGTIINAGGFAKASGAVRGKFDTFSRLGTDVDGVSDVASLAVETITQQNETINGGVILRIFK